LLPLAAPVYNPHMATAFPSPEVLASFGLANLPVLPVAGGQGDTFRVADLALKRAHDPRQTEWLSAILEKIPEQNFRIARPIRARSGDFAVDRWSAARWIEGDTKIENWIDAIAALDAFHAALRHVPDSPHLRRADTPYTRADDLVWSNQLPDATLGPTADRLFYLRRPLDLPAQLIQGDPSEGNLLFAPNLPPAIIDIAPYWHPSDYSVAMLIADGIAWSAAPLTLLDLANSRPEMPQLLLRAVLFRLYVGFLFRGGIEAAEKRARAYAPVIHAIEHA
jgi:uncharacterized protein (TIGR02569 family)